MLLWHRDSASAAVVDFSAGGVAGCFFDKSRGRDSDTDYARQNGGEYEFIVERANKTAIPTSQVGGCGRPYCHTAPKKTSAF